MMVWILGRNKQMKMLQIRGGGVMVMMARAWNCKSESSKTATNRMQAEAASLRLRCCLGLSPPKNNVVGRCFQSRAEYMDWTQRMIASRFTVERVEMDDEQERQRQTQTRLRRVPVKVAAPFLYSVSPISDRLLLFESEPKRIDAIGSSPTTNGTPGHTNIDIRPSARHGGRSPCDSMLECVYPLSESRYVQQQREPRGSTTPSATMTMDDLNILRASVSDLGSWSTFRLAKFYSDVDALTADVAYRHANRNGPGRAAGGHPKGQHADGHHADGHHADAAASNGQPPPALAFVTAGHYHSRKINRTDITRDLILRCYPTHTGSSSIEIRTDAIQTDDHGQEHLINVCFTSMVAVDPTSLRPMKNAIPPLAPMYNVPQSTGTIDDDDDDSSSYSSNNKLDAGAFRARQEEQVQKQLVRAAMAKEHASIRKARFATTMQLRHGPSSPPTQQEMADIHSLHQQVIAEKQNQHQHHRQVPSPSTTTAYLPHVREHTYRSSVVVYPEKRNVHGKLFGGFVMEQSHSLAQYAADFYLNHYSSSSSISSSLCCPDTSSREEKNKNITTEEPKNDHNLTNPNTRRAISLGMDEAVFLQPISIGDHVTFTARVVHSTSKTCRVLVIVEVRDPSDRHALPMRSNRVSYLFGTADYHHDRDRDHGFRGGFPEGIVPDAYNEILMHVDALRRSNVEGPLDEEVEMILRNDGGEEQNPR